MLTLDRERLRAFSSRVNGWGLPDKKAVRGCTWKLDVWWQGEGQVLHIGSGAAAYVFLYVPWQWASRQNGCARPPTAGMFDGRGKVRHAHWITLCCVVFSKPGLIPGDCRFLRPLRSIWPLGVLAAPGTVYSRTLDRKLLRSFDHTPCSTASGCQISCVPMSSLQWLHWTTSNEADQAITIMTRLYSGAYRAGHKSLGLPDINKLRQAEQKLMALISAEEHDQERHC